MTEKVEHYQIGTKYRIVFERAATKGVIGIKCEATGDSLDEVLKESQELFDRSKTFVDKFPAPTDISS